MPYTCQDLVCDGFKFQAESIGATSTGALSDSWWESLFVRKSRSAKKIGWKMKGTLNSQAVKRKEFFLAFLRGAWGWGLWNPIFHMSHDIVTFGLTLQSHYSLRCCQMMSLMSPQKDPKTAWYADICANFLYFVLLGEMLWLDQMWMSPVQIWVTHAISYSCNFCRLECTLPTHCRLPQLCHPFSQSLWSIAIPCCPGESHLPRMLELGKRLWPFWRRRNLSHLAHPKSNERRLCRSWRSGTW